MFMNACWSDAAVGGTVLALSLLMLFISENVLNSHATRNGSSKSSLEYIYKNFQPIIKWKFLKSIYAEFLVGVDFLHL